MLDEINGNYDRKSDEVQHYWNQQKCCAECFCDANGVSRSLYHKCHVLALANKHTFVKNPKGRSRPSPKRDYIAAWLKTYFEEVGDFEPTTGTLCLFVGVVVSLATKFSLVYCAGEVRISYAKRVDIKN